MSERESTDYMRTDEPDPEFPPPPRGANAEFDEVADKLWAALLAAGNREQLTEEVARNTLARAMGEKGGIRFGRNGVKAETDR